VRIKHTYSEEFEALILDLKDKYPKKLFELEGISEEALDSTLFSRHYFEKKKTSESSVDPNGNVQIRHIGTFLSEKHKAQNKLDSIHLLWKTARRLYNTNYANKLVEKEITKSIYINDLLNFYLPYCWAFDCYDVALQGLPFITNYPSTPAKHADAFLQHTIQLLQYAAPQLMGATAIPNFIVIFSAFIKKDSEDKNYYIPNWKEDKKSFEQYIKQAFQNLIYLLNQPLRISQSVFSNITIFDSIFLKELCKKYILFDKIIDADFAMYMQKMFIEVFIECNKNKLATFPVTTFQLKLDENKEVEDEEFVNYLAEVNLPFSSFNIFSDTSLNALSSCCRLTNNIEDMIKSTKDENMNLIGGSSIKVGSIGVSTINLSRLGLKHKGNIENFMKELEELAIDCYRINHCRRHLIEQKIEQGEMPLYSRGFINLKNQYSTLGINGLYEAVDFMGFDMKSNGGFDFAVDVLKKLEEISELKMKKYGYKCNIEQIPAETAAIKMAKTDEILYKQTDHKLYANQFIPLTIEASLLERIQLQASFEKYFSGGTILHVNVDHEITSKDIMKKLIKYVIKEGVKYFAINYFFQKCKNGHISVAKSNKCPVCGIDEIIERYTRVVGYLTPVTYWKSERQIEYHERKIYNQFNLK